MNKIDIMKELDKKMFEYILEEDKMDFMDKDSLDIMMLMLSTKLQAELTKDNINDFSKIKNEIMNSNLNKNNLNDNKNEKESNDKLIEKVEDKNENL